MDNYNKPDCAKHFGEGFQPKQEQRKVVKESKHSPCKIGEVITVKWWGTFGCWDTKNRWVDFYCTERV